ncbi:MAG: ABC transporter substrate-binding protein [Rhodocyclaceae bacterium]|nr:ABC transporter substrate-binding protein [Rhodocyclaceae bacterium]MBX3668877.1 ABC transporter substrate-binding protein [Rhodocyclaceae bacterium]
MTALQRAASGRCLRPDNCEMERKVDAPSNIFCRRGRLAAWYFAACAGSRSPRKDALTIAVGGKHRLNYLPLTLAERLGHFRQEGLELTIADHPVDATAVAALASGGADMVSAAYEYTIELHARGQNVQCVAVQGRYAGLALGLSSELAGNYKTPKDLKGLRIGVTAPGASSHLFVNVLLAKAGPRPEAVSLVAVGSGAAVTAMQKRSIDAIANPDPVINLLEMGGAITTVADTRTAEGQRYVFGSDYPAGVIVASEDFIRAHPRTTQALANGAVRALRWIPKIRRSKLSPRCRPIITARRKRPMASRCAKSWRDTRRTDTCRWRRRTLSVAC